MSFTAGDEQRRWCTYCAYFAVEEVATFAAIVMVGSGVAGVVVGGAVFPPASDHPQTHPGAFVAALHGAPQ
jgi:hypothetical protein